MGGSISFTNRQKKELMKISYSKEHNNIIDFGGRLIHSFLDMNIEDIDAKTVKSFGEEWSKFSSFSLDQIKQAGDEYFDILPQKILNKNTYVLDVGCGSGRWSKYLSDKVGFIECIDPSKAVLAAATLLKNEDNTRITQASVGNIPFPDDSFDLVMSVGVLHHIPNTEHGIKKCVEKVKKGGYFYVYLYYDMDGRNIIYKALFRTSNFIRYFISNLPAFLKKIICDIIAFTVYVPLVMLATIVKTLFGNFYRKFPLAYYVGKSLNIIRNDSLDRFGTPLEQRFTKQQITTMLENAGLENIQFSSGVPYWHVVGQKK